jgi:hypothetical protein
MRTSVVIRIFQNVTLCPFASLVSLRIKNWTMSSIPPGPVQPTRLRQIALVAKDLNESERILVCPKNRKIVIINSK